MSLDAGSTFALQFTSIGAVKAQQQASAVGRSVTNVTKSMRQARTAFSQVAGTASALGRVFGANLGMTAVAGTLAGRATGAMGMGGQQQTRTGAARVSGQVAEAVSGLVGLIAVSTGLAQLQARQSQQTITRIERRADQAVQQTARRSAGGGAVRSGGRMAGAAIGAKAGAGLGPIGMIIGSVIGFIAVGVVSQVAGRVVSSLVDSAFSVEDPRVRGDRQMFARFQGRPSDLRAEFLEERRSNIRANLQGGFFDQIRAGSQMAGDFLTGGRDDAGTPVPFTDIRTFMPGRSAVDRRLDFLESQIQQLERDRQSQVGEMLDVMQRNNRL